jgi:hypothetical protein
MSGNAVESTKEKRSGMRNIASTVGYRPPWTAWIAAIRSSMCRVRYGVMPSIRSITINCPRLHLVFLGRDQHFES